MIDRDDGFGWDAWVEARKFKDSIEIWLGRRAGPGDGWDKMVFELPKIERVPQGMDRGEASLELVGDTARRLMTALWNAGIRPHESRANADAVATELRATAKHLEDMRAIAFHKTGVAKP